MQSIVVLTLLLAHGVTVNALQESTVSAIAAVVRQLQNMLVASKTEADTEHVLYAKYVCYCNKNEARLAKSIATGEKSIITRKGTVEMRTTSNEVEGSKSGKLFADLASNVEQNSAAVALRGKENEAFVAKAADLQAAIAQMTSALMTLSGQDQSDHSRKMAGFASTAFLSVQTREQQALEQQALKSVEAYMNKEQYEQYSSYTSLLQGPGGDYTAESGKVLGMIKSMKDTSAKDLAEAQTAEAGALATHTELIANLVKANTDMTGLKGMADDKIGSNDESLAVEKQALATETSKLKTEVDEKVSLLAACKVKAGEYDKRVATRANEDAALAEAVTILDKDESFGSFQKVGSTKITAGGGSLLQEISEHAQPHESDAMRAVMKRLLARSAAAMSVKPAPKLKPVMSTLAVAGSPFDAVLKDITKMVKAVDDEEASDVKEMANCEATRIETESGNTALDTTLIELNQAIVALTTRIETPATGDVAMLETDQADLAANAQSQADQTKQRAEENVAYQKNIKNLLVAENTLTKAINVLKKFYDTLETAFIENHGGGAPATWGAKYAGQNGAGQPSVITMIVKIKTATVDENKAAHTAEATAQTEFEESMKKLVDAQKRLVTGIEARMSTDSSQLTNDQAERMSKNKAKRAAGKSFAANMALLASIKAGCDYIYTRATDPANNVLNRAAARTIEKASLVKAEKDLKNSTAYKYAQVQKVHASYGECDEKCVPMLNARHADSGFDCQATPDDAKCVGLPDHVNCKACMAGVTVKGYCAGHELTDGCTK